MTLWKTESTQNGGKGSFCQLSLTNGFMLQRVVINKHRLCSAWSSLDLPKILFTSLWRVSYEAVERLDGDDGWDLNHIQLLNLKKCSAIDDLLPCRTDCEAWKSRGSFSKLTCLHQNIFSLPTTSEKFCFQWIYRFAKLWSKTVYCN